jgi:hypothetical protein
VSQSRGIASDIGGSKVSTRRRAIKSEGDEIVNQDKEAEGVGGSGEEGASDQGGEEGGFDFGDLDEAQDVDGEFMEEVNDVDEFGADEPALDKNDVVDALQAIGEIIDTVLQAEGVEKENGITSDEQGFVLDQVEDLAAGFGDEEEEGSGEDIGAGDELGSGDQEELMSSFVRVLVAGDPVRSGLVRGSYISAEKFAGSPAVVCQGINSSLKLQSEDVVKDSLVDTVILSSVQDIKEDTDIKAGYIRVSDVLGWRKQSPEHGKAWSAAFSKVSRKLGHKPGLAREIGAVGCVASSLYDKWYTGNAQLARKIEKVLSGKRAGNLHRVLSAVKGRIAEGKSLKVVKSDYNGYRNFETWNAAIYLKENESLNASAKEFLRSNRGASYDQLVRGLGLAGKKTPDQVDWLDQQIDRREMAKVLMYLSSAYRGKGMGRAIKSDAKFDADGGEVITVQDDTPGGISVSGETLGSGEIEGEGGIRVERVDGGDTSEVLDVDNTGNDGSLEADVDAGTEFNDSGYSFESGKIAALQLPIEDDNDHTQVLELREIGSGVYILNRAFLAPGGGRCSFVKGRDAVKVLSQGLKPSGIKASVDRVLTLKNSKNGLLVKSSAVLGVIAVEAPFTKGLRNAKYTVFSRTGVNLADAEGHYIPAINGPDMVIASAVSNKAVRQGKEKRDIFSEAEREYIRYLGSCLSVMGKKNAQLKAQLASALKSRKRDAEIHSRVLNRERAGYQRQVASSLADLQSIRIKTAESEAGRVFSASQQVARREEEEAKLRRERNIEFLSRIF